MKNSQYLIAFFAILFMILTFFEPWQYFFRKNETDKILKKIIRQLRKIIKVWNKENFILPLGRLSREISKCFPDSVIGVLSYQNHLDLRGSEWSRDIFREEASLSMKEHTILLTRALEKKDKLCIFLELITLNYINHYSDTYPLNGKKEERTNLESIIHELANDLKELDFDRFSHAKICLLREKWLIMSHKLQNVSIYMIAKYLSVFKIRFPSSTITNAEIGELAYHLWGFLIAVKENSIEKQYSNLENLINLGRNFLIIA